VICCFIKQSYEIKQYKIVKWRKLRLIAIELIEKIIKIILAWIWLFFPA
jgi:hypothetical protein